MDKIERAARYLYCSLVGVLSGIVVNFLGGWDSDMETLVLFMGVDFITGLIVAYLFCASPKTPDGHGSSLVCFKGLIRKCGILVAIGLLYRVDMQFNSTLLRSTSIIAFTMNEAISICENLDKMDVPLVNRLTGLFKGFRDMALTKLRDLGKQAEKEISSKKEEGDKQ